MHEQTGQFSQNEPVSASLKRVTACRAPGRKKSAVIGYARESRLRCQERGRGANRMAVMLRDSLTQMFSWAGKRQPWRKLLAEGAPHGADRDRKDRQPRVT